MATRKKRKAASKRSSSPVGWFVGGIALGLIGAVVLYTKGFMPAGPERDETTPRPKGAQEPELIDSGEADEDPRYDFFTVLPEMEVVVPQRELSDKAEPQTSPTDPVSEAESFILQVGSFKNSADADQMKAQLALLGTVANVQQVNVNGQTWHRVRIGPVDGARATDQLRRQLQDNGIDVLVLKASS